MARFDLPRTQPIYDAAARFLTQCLQNDSTLFDDNAPVWTLENLQTIKRVFVDAPEEGKRKFLEKFKDQIKPADRPVEPTICRLAAELLIVYFLFPSNVGGVRKRQVVNEVLRWGDDNLPEPNLVSSAFVNGIGSGGQGYNTRRPFEIAFLIELAIVWKNLPPDRQVAVANDPKLFQKLVDDIEDADSKQLRHMLLHLLFPENFERIASGNHKRRVIKAFAGLGIAQPEDDDLAIQAIRNELTNLLPNQTLDFYSPPLKGTWYDESDEALGGAPLEIVEHKKQIVLYGPPGTGKTYRAKKLAERIIRSAALRQMKPALYFQSQPAVEKAILDNVHRLQLHPAYSYEDFIRALHISKTGGTEYRAGYLLRLIADIEKQPLLTRLPHVLILDEMNRTDLSRMLGECFSLLEDRKEPVEVPGIDQDGAAMKLCIPDDLFVIGTMNLIDQSIEQVDFALRRRFLWLACPFDKVALLGAAESKWRDLKSGLDWECIQQDFLKLATAAEALNKNIENSELLGAQYEIGHTYLLDVVVFLRNFLSSGPTRRQNYLWNNGGEALKPVVQVWKLSLCPLLEQYLAGLNAKVRDAEVNRLSKVFLKTSAAE